MVILFSPASQGRERSVAENHHGFWEWRPSTQGALLAVLSWDRNSNVCSFISGGPLLGPFRACEQDRASRREETFLRADSKYGVNTLNQQEVEVRSELNSTVGAIWKSGVLEGHLAALPGLAWSL